jgi:hypothetical protein
MLVCKCATNGSSTVCGSKVKTLVIPKTNVSDVLAISVLVLLIFWPDDFLKLCGSTYFQTFLLFLLCSVRN